jgi:hypothetical protein
MKIESQVCSVEQAKKLKEIGAHQESAFYYQGTREEVTNGKGCLLSYGKQLTHKDIICVSAFTLSELIEVLGEGFESLCHAKDGVFGKWEAYGYWNEAYHLSSGKTPIIAAVNLILKLHKEGLIFNDKKAK